MTDTTFFSPSKPKYIYHINEYNLFKKQNYFLKVNFFKSILLKFGDIKKSHIEHPDNSGKCVTLKNTVKKLGHKKFQFTKYWKALA